MMANEVRRRLLIGGFNVIWDRGTYQLWYKTATYLGVFKSEDSAWEEAHALAALGEGMSP